MIAQITQASSLSSISSNLMIFHLLSLELFLNIVIFFFFSKNYIKIFSTSIMLLFIPWYHFLLLILAFNQKHFKFLYYIDFMLSEFYFAIKYTQFVFLLSADLFFLCFVSQ